MAQDPFDLTGKVALVTGGSRGLGHAMALGFARRGADVIVTSRKADQCEAVADEIRALGRQALAYGCHVGRWEELEGLVEAAYARFGKVDILVNNAGIAPVTDRSINMTEDLFDKTIGVNMKGPFRLAALVGERMAAGDGGAIINITSTGAIRPQPAFAVYAAAKGALNILTEALAKEFGPKVRVNAIMAGPFWTDIAKSWREEVDANIKSAVGRIGRPEEIVTSALYLASPASTYTTGMILRLDGGQP